MDLLQPSCISVSQLNAIAKNLLETNLAGLWVSGEISNATASSSGHFYFSLKDKQAQVQCVLFKGNAQKNQFTPKVGDEVELSGEITLYEARGTFQINVYEIRPVGAGNLYAAFERLKQKLTQEGLFSENRKKSVPNLPKTVGIITSPAAAALRDVVKTLKNRMPSINIVLYPTSVQGKGSEIEIAEAIKTADIRQEVDVLIICRGGGSLEDLWSFNEEVVVRAIANCSLPTVSGVGHETDFTLCDFAADLRAATPTAAAMAVSPNKEELLTQINNIFNRIEQSCQYTYQKSSQSLDLIEQLFIYPQTIVDKYTNHLDNLSRQISDNINQKIKNIRHNLDTIEININNARPNLSGSLKDLVLLEHRLNQTIDYKTITLKQTLAHLDEIIEISSPQHILNRGFSIVTNNKGNIISDSTKIQSNQDLNIKFANGVVSVVSK